MATRQSPHSPLQSDNLRLHLSSALLAPALLAVLVTLGCSSSTEPGHPTPQLTHPAGNIDSTAAIPGNAHGIAIAPDGTMLITRVDSQDVVSGRANDFALGPVIKVGGAAVDVAITPDAHTAFIPMNSGPHIAIVDVRSAAMTGSLTIFSWPLRALVTPDGNHVYVTTTGGLSDTVSTVYDFDAHTHALIDTMLVGEDANGITYDATRKRLYVSARATSSVYEIDATQDVVLRRIPVGPLPQDIAVSPDGSELWVATEGDAGVQIYDLVTGAFNQAVPNTSQAFGLAMTPDGAQVYITRNSVRQCAIIDAHTHLVVKPFVTGFSPMRIAFNATGSRAVITDGESGAVLIQ